jgi:hypothetical protein
MQGRIGENTNGKYKWFSMQVGRREECKDFGMQGRLNNAVKSEYRINKWLLRKYLRIKAPFYAYKHI